MIWLDKDGNECSYSQWRGYVVGAPQLRARAAGSDLSLTLQWVPSCPSFALWASTDTGYYRKLWMLVLHLKNKGVTAYSARRFYQEKPSDDYMRYIASSYRMILIKQKWHLNPFHNPIILPAPRVMQSSANAKPLSRQCLLCQRVTTSLQQLCRNCSFSQGRTLLYNYSYANYVHHLCINDQLDLDLINSPRSAWPVRMVKIVYRSSKSKTPDWASMYATEKAVEKLLGSNLVRKCESCDRIVMTGADGPCPDCIRRQT